MEDLNAGDVVAGYTIEAMLGRGGMGAVYRARHPTLPRSVALKILTEDSSRTAESRARFIQEADLVANLNHPHIVRVYDRGETAEHQLWIAMELIEGADAEKEMKAGRMPPRRIIKILSEVAEALDYAHRRNILHRDIKPANFLISDEDDGRAYLADFGIARALEGASSLTRTGNVMASLPYVAPESLHSAKPIDHRADLYSLGCAIFTLFSGREPFAHATGGGAASLMGAHLLQEPPKLTQIVPTLPPALDAVMAKVMAKNPDDRYQSAREFSAAVAHAFTGAPITRTEPWPATGSAGGAPPPTPPPSQFPPASPPSGFPAGRTDAVEYPSGYFSGPNASSLQAAAGMPPARRRRRPIVIGAIVLVVLLTAAGVTGALMWGGDQAQPYQAQTFEHAHGSTKLTAAPKAVAALGPGDADAVLSLDVQPVVMTAPSGLIPQWEQAAVTGSPTTMAVIDTTAVAAAHPDVIIATGDLDDATYAKLAEIAPTITRAADKAAAEWDWENQLSWIGRILGKEGAAKDRINAVRVLQGDLSNQNPAFKGRSVQAITVTDTGVNEILIPSFTATYLESLGFRYNLDLTRTAADSEARPANDSRMYGIETDYLIVIRTDSAAHGGGYANLPKPLKTYSGKMVVIDDPSTVAALTSSRGGYLLIKYLDDSVVGAIAQA